MLQKNKLTSSTIMLVMFMISVTQSCISQNKDNGFVKIFDGKTLKGWDADTSFWRVENGVIVGQVFPGKPIKTNTFLIWKGGQPADFEFKADYRISPEGNSGVQYRSEELKDIRFSVHAAQIVRYSSPEYRCVLRGRYCRETPTSVG